jgi:GxxExxY protein
LQNVTFSKQVKIDIFYSGDKIGEYISDIVISNKIICELKTKPFITGEDEKQFWGYLKVSV